MVHSAVGAATGCRCFLIGIAVRNNAVFTDADDAFSNPNNVLQQYYLT